MFRSIADLYFAELKRIIEMDSGVHNTAAQQEHDARRTQRSESEGFQVAHFTNDQVLMNMITVMGYLEDLMDKIEQEASDASRERWADRR